LPAKILARAKGDGAMMCSKTKIKRMRNNTVTMALIPRLMRKKRIFGISNQLQNLENPSFGKMVIKTKW